MKIDSLLASKSVIHKATRIIRSGGIVLYPSDTVYGLGCDPLNSKALLRLFEIKGRPQKKAVLLLIENSSWVYQFSQNVPKLFHKLANIFWPGPVTFLLEGKDELHPLLLGEKGQIGLRCPLSLFLQLWMRTIPGPIVSTSANQSGCPPPKSLDELKTLFFDSVDLFLEEGQDLPQKQSSTVVDLTEHPPKIVRYGGMAQKVEESLKGITP